MQAHGSDGPVSQRQPAGVTKLVYEEDARLETTSLMGGSPVTPIRRTDPVPAPMPAIPAVVEKPVTAAPPKKPSWIRGIFKQYGKHIAIAVIGSASYGAFKLYEYRQPYEWSGSVEAHTVSVGSRTGGRVRDVLVREGQEVKAGTVLVQLEAGETEAKKAQAEADLEAATAALQKLQNGARPEELSQASARLEEARASAGKEAGRAAQEQKELARTKWLHSGGAVSTVEEEAKTGAVRVAAGSAAEATARAREAEAALKLLLGGTRPEDLRIAAANVAVARGKLAAINTQIEELAIRAPRDSRVESIVVRPGDMLKENLPAATLLENGELYVRIYVPETQLGQIRVGQTVPITVDSFAQRSFQGRVEHINDLGEFTPRKLTTTEDRASEVFGARVTILEGDSELRAGMAAFIHVPKRR